MQTRSHQPFIAEIIGPAGSGKTTLSQMLEQNREVRTGLSLWRLPVGLLIRSSVASLPRLFELLTTRQQFDRKNIKLLIQYHALLTLVKSESPAYDALLLDEGTVFALAKLYRFRAVDSKSDAWINSLFDELVPLLNAVIWLDAPDEVLARRIREREKPHSMKDESDAALGRHIAAYRSSYKEVVAELSRRNQIKVLKFSTDQISLEQIAQKVLSEARVGA